MQRLHYCLLIAQPRYPVLSEFIIAISFLIVALALACLIFFMIARQKQNKLYLQQKAMEELEKQLMQSQIEIQESTLTVLGKELHDNVGQLLSSSKMLLGITMRNISQTPDTLTVAYETLSKAITELRTLSRTLDSEWLQQFNLIDNLKEEVARNTTRNLAIHLTCTDKLHLKAEQQILLFRIIQEGIQNAIKHAAAASITITLQQTPTHLAITIADDGTGFDTGSTAIKGAGINNIKHRASALGGSAAWQSSGTGTTLAIHIPIQNHEA